MHPVYSNDNRTLVSVRFSPKGQEPSQISNIHTRRNAEPDSRGTRPGMTGILGDAGEAIHDPSRTI